MFLNLTLLFWLILNPIGNVAPFVSFVGALERKRQFFVIAREMLIALGVLILALFFGEGFFHLLQIQTPALSVTGGIILFLISFRMIFSEPSSAETISKHVAEPLIVPLAVPLVAGPGILAAIILYSGAEAHTGFVLAAILTAWAACLPILLFAPWIKHLLGINGTIAVERIFGFIIVVIATQTIIQGLVTHLHS
ncbi:MAG: MarC family protein [Verrucomicrobia bacterium]|nr:MarC family protein [Verrucomicrobiota bacterium]MBS0646892.1 MarC family protein [Verrucomicrobiota bacterium]